MSRLSWTRTPPLRTCAGCGAEVRRAVMPSGSGHQLWGEKMPSGGWNYACRWTPGKAPGTVATIDYHYVEGEEQRHFVSTDPVDVSAE